MIQRGGEPIVVDDTLMYVFNYDNNQGYALVSTNLATEPLIAVTEQGHLDPSQETDNPGLKLYLEMAKQYVAKTKNIITSIGAGTDMIMVIIQMASFLPLTMPN